VTVGYRKNVIDSIIREEFRESEESEDLLRGAMLHFLYEFHPTTREKFARHISRQLRELTSPE
jgi:hypothetical protein